MNSIRFPNMFENNSTTVTEGKSASLQNLKLLLGSEKGELLGDPFFGIRKSKYIFNQNGFVLKDIIVDEIFTQIKVFAPQLTVMRQDIKIFQKGTALYAKIKATNNIDFQTDTYDLVLFQIEER